MNFKEHFEKFEADLRKKMLDDETYLESVKKITSQHDELTRKLDTLITGFNEQRKLPEDPFFTNEEFMALMSISVRTAQLWRDQGLIGFSQVSGKIYYKMSDIRKLLDDNYHKAVRKAGKL